jgi:hypothetical protein
MQLAVVVVVAVAVAVVAVEARWFQNQALQGVLARDGQSCFRRRVRCWGQHGEERSILLSTQNVVARSLLAPVDNIQRQAANGQSLREHSGALW